MNPGQVRDSATDLASYGLVITYAKYHMEYLNPQK